jgi:signal transduction histidine kinase/HAMP domain-containing protein
MHITHTSSSLRARLLQLVLLSVLPALALILYTAGEQRVKNSHDAEQEALRLVRLVSASQQRMIDSTRHLLVALANLSEVRGRDRSGCSALFAKLLKEYPLYANFGVADSGGTTFCSAVAVSGPVHLGDRTYFSQAVKRKNFAIGEYQVGRLTGRASLNMGYPVLDHQGNVGGVVFAALDLNWFHHLVRVVDLPPSSSLAVYDRQGTVLARIPEGEEWVGKPVPEAEMVTRVLAQREGVAEAAGPHGEKRIYAFTSIGNENQIFLHLGIPIEVALADADGLLLRNLLALFAVSLLALVAAWYAGDVFVLRPLRALIDTTARLGAGDLSARTGLPHQPNEIGRLAAAFDEMAASLETQHRKTSMTGRRLERNLARIKALHDIDMAITSNLDLGAMLHLLLEKIDVVLPGAVSTIRLTNAETRELEPVASRNIDETEWRKGNARNVGAFARIVLESKSPLAVANVQNDARNERRRFAQRFGLISYLGVPLIVKGEVLGLIAVYTREEHAFSDEEIEFLTMLASQSAIAIHNARLYDETRRSADELAALHGLTIAATQSLDMDVVLREAVEKITGIFHFDATRIFLFDSQMEELRVAAAFEAEPELWKDLHSFRRGQGIVGRVAESAEPLIFEDVAQDARYRELSHSRVLERNGASFLAILPIATRLKTWGVLVVVGKQPRKLQGHEARLILSMTNQIGIAVEKATLYAQTAAKAKELAALYSIAGLASESLDINTVLQKTMEKVLEIFDFDAARIYLLNEYTGDLELVTHRGIPPGVPLMPSYRVGEGRVGGVIQSGEAMFVEDMATDAGYQTLAHNKNMLKAGFHASLLIPLKVRGQGLGVMNFVGKKPYQFAESDIQLINAIAYHLGVAVGNARLFSQVKRKTVELERASKGKDEFLGVISHELRTPLNVIKGYTEIMRQGVLGEIGVAQKKALETISNQAVDLFNMINGILHVTKIEADAVQTASWEVNLVNLLDQMRTNYSIPFGKELRVEWDFPHDLPVIKTDEEKLKAVVQNLVNNAIKFTEKGTVKISVRRLAESGEIEFKIADTGIGIPKEKLGSIFEMFLQVDSSATRKHGGVGLGLYIVKKFTELLGGRIAVESEFGKGSTFTMSLPIDPGERRAGSSPAPAAPADPLTPPRLSSLPSSASPEI